MRDNNIHNLTKSNEAIKSAYSALSFIEQIDSCIEGIKYVNNELPLSQRQELEVYIDKLENLLKLIDNNPEEAGLTELIKGIPLTQFGYGMSKIERLGLAGQVIRMKEINKLTNREIAETLGVAVSSVSRFLKYYESAPLSTKATYQRQSIFDTSTQYEEVGTMIYRQLSRLENDPENHVRYISELRQLLKAANDWMDRVQSQNQMAEVKEAVVEVLSSCIPEKRDEIIRMFSSIGIKGFRSVKSIEGV